jgi:calcineurin-like phosphoesterase family protein
LAKQDKEGRFIIWFTSDEHYFHENLEEGRSIIKYAKRPFATIEEMNAAIIARHNEVVKDDDEVWHLGDFVLGNDSVDKYVKIVNQLKGRHHFLYGSHDRWMEHILGKGAENLPYIREIKIEKIRITLCHYAMRRWPHSHHGSWQLYGHSHGELPPIGKQYDVGVDNNNFYPVSFEFLKNFMKDRIIEPNHLDNK